MDKFIQATGVKTNNLKNIDVQIPRGKITALVGVSGAGKTSLAFDTIYAEGYLRYIESISPYIRQFLDKIEKPPVESIDGLPPAIAFRHKKPAKNPRSIVATSLDIFDYLRIMYAKIADFFCPSCGKEIKKYSIDEMIAQLLENHSGIWHVCFQYKGDVAFLINRGYYFYIQNGNKKRIDHSVKDKTIHVLIDSVEILENNKSRIFEALDKSIVFGKGDALLFQQDQKILFPSDLYCDKCETHYPPPDEHLFSFNSPRGACPGCNGFGDVQNLDPQLIFDPKLSLYEGAVRPFSTPATQYDRNVLLRKAEDAGIDVYRPLELLDKSDMDFIMNGDGAYGGVRGFFDWLKTKSYKVQARVFVSRYTTYEPCLQCGGSRLNPLARSFKITGKSLTDFLAFSIGQAAQFIKELDQSQYQSRISPDVFRDIRSRLDYLVESGLAYINLNRPTFTLSRGEYQRINLAFILGSTLSDSLLIIDQPSSDLHPHDYRKLRNFLLHLKENQNTVLLIEHNKDIVQYVDHVIELGPLSGEDGGTVVFSGSATDFFNGNNTRQNNTPQTATQTITQSHFNRPHEEKPSPVTFKKWYSFKNADTHNLKNFNFKIPAHAFTVIAGVSGAGKTTLLYDEIYLKKNNLKHVEFIDPGIANLRASTIVAGFYDVYPAIREIFAGLQESRIHRYTPGHFSFNSPRGRCEECKGKGYVEMEMQFLPSVHIPCDACSGTGFKPDVLKILYHEKNIRQVLNLSVNQWIQSADADMSPKTRDILGNIKRNGLGYLKLGQPLKTLSAGELQRVKLVKHLNAKKKNTLFLIDEPSFGLHPFDIQMVKKLIRRIIENQNTVVAAEHNLELVAFADYIIELGPGGGENGGQLVFQGPVSEVEKHPAAITGVYLKKNKKKP